MDLVQRFFVVGTYRQRKALGETQFADAIGMARAIREHPKLGPCMLQKLLIYSLGRGLEPEEQCMVDDVTEASANGGYRSSAIIDAIVTSPLFTKRGAVQPEAAAEEAGQ